MVRMLVADDACRASPARNSAAWSGSADWRCRPPSRAGIRFHIAGSAPPGRGGRSVAGHDLDPGAADAAEAQRRAAGGAEIALGDRGGFERRRLAAGPAKVRVLDIGEARRMARRRLLAHPAMADADPGRSAPDSAKRTAPHWQPPVRTGLRLRCHAHSIRRQASCSIASASPPAKMKSPTPAARSAASCSPGRPAR